MADPQRYQNRIEILQGTLDLLILQTLARGEQHGHGISQTIRARSGELLSVETGSLFPLSIGSKRKAGSIQSGKCRRTISEPSTTP